LSTESSPFSFMFLLNPIAFSSIPLHSMHTQKRLAILHNAVASAYHVSNRSILHGWHNRRRRTVSTGKCYKDGCRRHNRTYTRKRSDRRIWHWQTMTLRRAVHHKA
jgi:hypothetical protein